MKNAHACAALILATAFLVSCATRAPAPEKPYLVQLSATLSSGHCDWSLMQNVNERSGLNGPLGAAYWPHAVPLPSRFIRPRSAPLRAYGTGIAFSWPQPNERLCLALYKRPSVWQENVPPALALEISQDPAGAEIHALTSNPTLSNAIVAFTSAGPDPDFPSKRIDLILSDGRAQGGVAPPPVASRVRVVVVVTEAGGEAQTERALELLTTAGVEENLIVREGSRLVARPSWPGAGKRSSQPR